MISSFVVIVSAFVHAIVEQSGAIDIRFAKTCMDFRIRSMNVVAESAHLDFLVGKHADAGTRGFGLRPEAAILYEIGEDAVIYRLTPIGLRQQSHVIG